MASLKNKNRRRKKLLMNILNQYIQQEKEVIKFEVPNDEFTMSDVSLTIDEFRMLLRAKDKVLDYGFEQREKTIKAKLIIE
jgi:hypothetical protein